MASSPSSAALLASQAAALSLSVLAAPLSRIEEGMYLGASWRPLMLEILQENKPGADRSADRGVEGVEK